MIEPPVAAATSLRPDLGFKSVLAETWARLKGDSRGLIWISLGLTAISVLATLALGESFFGFIASYPIQLIAEGLTLAAAAALVLNAGGSNASPLRAAAGTIRPKLVAIILLSVVAGIAISLGFLALIVPGVIFALMWCVSIPALINEGTGIFGSMSRSEELTRGNRIGILWLALTTLLLEVIVTGISFAVDPLGIAASNIVGVLLGAVTTAFTGLLFAVIYLADPSPALRRNAGTKRRRVQSGLKRSDPGLAELLPGCPGASSMARCV